MASTQAILGRLRTVCRRLDVTIHRTMLDPDAPATGDDIELEAPAGKVFAATGTHFLVFASLHENNRERYVAALDDLDAGLDTCDATADGDPCDVCATVGTGLDTRIAENPPTKGDDVD